MIRFITHYRSLAMLFGSVLLSSIIQTQSFFSHFNLFINIALLLTARMIIQFKTDAYKTPSILILISVCLTAIFTEPTKTLLFFEAVNFALLLGMWYMTEWEKKNHLPA